MPIIDGIFCFVHTPDGPLKEFLYVDGPSPNSASTYILARDGQEFFIKCSAPSPHKHMPVASTDGLSIHLRIDGISEQPMLLDHAYPSLSIKGTRILSSTQNWELRKFLFSSVEFTEESGHGELTLENISKLGEILVSVRRFRRSGSSEAGVGRSGSDLEKKRIVIHEKAIKGRDISHSVQRAKGEQCAPVTTAKGMYLDTDDNPLMTFRFLYKSERALKNMGLIERSPSPPPHLDIEGNPSLARSGLVKNEKSQIKRERVGSVGPFGRSKIQRRQEVSDIETIDLTGDD